MRGDLVEKTAADVCRDLAASEASGFLAIDGPDGPARVVFAAGRIIAAVSPAPRARLGDRLVGAGELNPDDLARALRSQDESGQNPRLGALLVEQGLVRPDAVRVFVQEQVLDALFEILRWRYGSFAFTADDGDGPTGVPLSLAVDDALVEVARRQQEWQQLSRVIPDLEAIPSFRQGAATASASLEPDEFAVLASVDGERSIRSLASDLGYGEFEAARIVYGLSLLGIVDVRPAQAAIPSAPAGDPAIPPPPPPAASTDMPDFFASTPARAPQADEPSRDDDADDDNADDNGAMLDITFDVPDPSSDQPQQGSKLSEALPADSFSELYADDDSDADERSAETADPDDTPSGDEPGHWGLPASAPQRGDDNDVSEFLRELSRLSLDPPAKETPSRPQPPKVDPPAPSQDQDSGKKKRRGLFGRG